MNPEQVQSLVLRAPHGPAVAHLILSIPDGRGGAAMRVLRRCVPVSFGVQAREQPCCSVGFSFDGLDAGDVPEGYLRLFRRLAPAFRDGAVQRSLQVGDNGASAASRWRPPFRPSYAHVLVSWHGPADDVQKQAVDLERVWAQEVRPVLARPLFGQRLGAPPGQEDGGWVHYGYRDGISEVSIDDALPRPTAKDLRPHAPGALLLGHVDDAGTNRFVLSHAPEKVRTFFRDSSFGILRPMLQDVAAFEAQVDRWVAQLAPLYPEPVSRDFVKAKLCGRWPDGRLLRPEDRAPAGGYMVRTDGEDFADDELGHGCPYGAHIRRMRSPPDGHGRVFERPLQRRSMPFGKDAWTGVSPDDGERGLFGHFFCASIEDQFEHLLGQWAAGPPLGFPRDDSAPDPLVGQNGDADATLRVPLRDRPTQHLSGFSAWTTTLGMMYAWHPGARGLAALLDGDFVKDDDDRERPWR